MNSGHTKGANYLRRRVRKKNLLKAKGKSSASGKNTNNTK